MKTSRLSWSSSNQSRNSELSNASRRKGRGAVRQAVLPVMEGLEGRTMFNSTAIFPPQFGVQGTDLGDSGEVLTGDVPVYLIYAGGSTGFGSDGSLSADQVTAGVKNILASDYLSGLSEYSAATHAHVAGTAFSGFNLKTNYSMSDINDLVSSEVTDNGGPLPDPDNGGVYIVITPKGFTIDSGSGLHAIGFHDQSHTGGLFDLDSAVYAAVTSSGNTAAGNFGPLGNIEVVLSHELVESITDPDVGDDVTTTPTAAFKAAHSDIVEDPGEIGDNEAELYVAHVGNDFVQAYSSKQFSDYRAPGATKQLFKLTNGDLTVNGDQFGSNFPDNVIIGKSPSGGVSVTLNSDEVDFAPGQVTQVNVNTGGGPDQIQVAATVVPTFVTSNPSNPGPIDKLIIGDGVSTQNINALLNVNNLTGQYALKVTDGGDPTGRTVGLINGGSNSFSEITGLTTVPVVLQNSQVTGLTIETGQGANTVNVQSAGIPVTLLGHGGADTINVGNNGSLADIRNFVTVQNAGGQTALHVDDGTDTTARTFTLDDVFPTGTGRISGFGTGGIDYTYAQTRSVDLTLGTGGNTVNVKATGAPTSLLGGSTSILINPGPINPVLLPTASKVSIIRPPLRFGGPDTINIGNNGSVQNIRQALSIANAFGKDTINVDDGTDTTARTVTFDNGANASDGDATGTITGLAPAPINYEYNDTKSVTVTLGTGGNTVNVNATGAPTTITGGSVPLIPIVLTNKIAINPIGLPRVGGPDTINVGTGSSVQNIAGPLTIENPFAQNTINVDDGTDKTARTVTLDTITPDADAVPYGTITGLAPAAINYEYADTKSIAVTLGVAGNTVNVNATGVPTSLVGGSVSILPPPIGPIDPIGPIIDPIGPVSTALTTKLAINPNPILINPNPIVLNPPPIIHLPRVGGPDTINIGNAGNAQNVAGALTIVNAFGKDTITVDDSADATARKATLEVAAPNGDSDQLGTISGLTPATITYEAADTASLTINGGSGGNTFNVNNTPTNQVNSSGGPGITVNTGTGDDTVNILAQGAGTTLTLHGQDGNDTLNLIGSGPADTFSVVSASQIAHGTATIDYDAIENLSLPQATAAAALAGGGKFDVGAGSLLIRYSGFSPIAAIRSAIQGGGIFSSKADASHGLGYADSADGVVKGLAPNTVLVKFTRNGDANLDQKVDFADLLLLAQHYNTKTAIPGWVQGDFNYDGKVDFTDLLGLAQNYGK